jgi:hypothetical protein
VATWNDEEKEKPCMRLCSCWQKWFSIFHVWQVSFLGLMLWTACFD